jgi:hypothetical protein
MKRNTVVQSDNATEPYVHRQLRLLIAAQLLM